MSNDNDNFNPFESDKTVILPTPGGLPKNGVPPGVQPAQASPPPSSAKLALPKIAQSLPAEDNLVLGNCISLISYAAQLRHCLLYTSPSPRDQRGSRMPSSA